MHFRRLVLIGFVLALLPISVLAHGGGTPILTRVEVGPYWVYVFSEPATPAAGAEYHVTVAVTHPQDNGSEIPVEDAEIAVRFIPEQGEPRIVQGEASIAGPGYYEADTILPSSGAWQVQVEVRGSLGAGSVDYTTVARASTGIAWGWIGAGVAVVLVGVLSLLPLVMRSRKPMSARTSTSDVKAKV